MPLTLPQMQPQMPLVPAQTQPVSVGGFTPGYQKWWQQWLQNQAAMMQQYSQAAHSLGPFANLLVSPGEQQMGQQRLMMSYLAGNNPFAMGGTIAPPPPTDGAQ